MMLGLSPRALEMVNDVGFAAWAFLVVVLLAITAVALWITRKR